jgi:hypothetical protein
LLHQPFQGYFQKERYVYLDEEGTRAGEPVQRMRVRSLIARPAQDARLEGGVVEVQGLAWSGEGSIAKVELSTDGGHQWRAAELEGAASPYEVQRWRYSWTPEKPGSHTLLSRATDSNGNTQPKLQRWNRYGYGNNGLQAVRLMIT